MKEWLQVSWLIEASLDFDNRSDSASEFIYSQDPFAKKEVYHDGPINSFFIKYFSAKMAEQLGRELPHD